MRFSAPSSSRTFDVMRRARNSSTSCGMLVRPFFSALACRIDRRSSKSVGWISATRPQPRSEEHTSELQSLMRSSYAVFCLKKKKKQYEQNNKHKTMYKTKK